MKFTKYPSVGLSGLAVLRQIIYLLSLISFFCLAAQVSNITPLAILTVFGLASFFLPGRVRPSLFTWVFAVFFLYHILSDYFIFPETSGFAMYRRMLYSFLAGTAMFYALGRARADFTVQHSLAMLAVLAVGVTFFMLFGNIDDLFLGKRLKLFFRHPNILATSCVVVIFSGLSVLLNDSAQKREVAEPLVRFFDNLLLSKYFVWLSLFVTVPVLWFTYSRSAFFFSAFIIAVMLFIHIWQRLGKKITLGLGVGVVLIAVAIFAITPLDEIGAGQNRTIGLLTNAPWKDPTFISRTPIWESSIQAFKQAPLLGHGPESFSSVHAVFMKANYERLVAEFGKGLIDSDTILAPHAHNMYLMQLAEGGLFGLLLLLVLLLSPIVSAIRNRTFYGVIVPVLGFIILMGFFECPFFGNFAAAFNITVAFMCLGYWAALKGSEQAIKRKDS